MNKYLELRNKTGLDRKTFAKILDVHPDTVGRWENGVRKPQKTHKDKLLVIEETLEKLVHA